MSTKQLFVLPPAFGLPSIDAECNAAVALLQLRLADGYEIIPTYDHTTRLPYLVDGNSHISGFNGILRHLATQGIFDEYADLPTQQRADSLAITAFIEAHAQTLVDISLYISFDNYRHTTRPAFTKVLPWHANYIIPPQRRAAARARTEHLGISSIDVDNVHEDMSNRPPGFEAVGKDQAFEVEAQKRASLLLPRKETLRSLLQRPEHAAVFRLHALADTFFGPLVDLLGKEQFVLHTETPRAVDCLLYGCLSLMLYPQMPQDWLTSTMRRKYQTLTSYTERLHEYFSAKTEVKNVLLLAKCTSQQDVLERRRSLKVTLPWGMPNISSASTVLTSVGNAILDQIPVFRSASTLQLLHARQPPWLERHLSTVFLSATASGVALVYLALRGGLLVWPHGQELQIFGKRRLADYGHLGAALAGISLAGPHGQFA